MTFEILIEETTVWQNDIAWIVIKIIEDQKQVVWVSDVGIGYVYDIGWGVGIARRDMCCITYCGGILYAVIRTAIVAGR